MVLRNFSEEERKPYTLRLYITQYNRFEAGLHWFFY